MRKFGAIVAAVLGLAYASPSHAGYPGYYTASFTYPGGTFNQCFKLTQTNKVAGYKPSGTWLDISNSGSGGQWVQYNNTFHLAGYLTDSDGGQYQIAVDGVKSNGMLISTTFDIFSPTGVYFAAGTFTEVSDPSSCASEPAASVKHAN